MAKKIDIGEAPLCACGCGQKVNRNPYGYAKWNKYINGHNRRGTKNSEYWHKRIREAKTGKPTIISEEAEKERRRKISSSMKGKPKSKEYSEKMSKILKDKYKNDNKYKEQMYLAREKTKKKRKENPISNETRLKMSIAATKRINIERENGEISKRLEKLLGEEKFKKFNPESDIKANGYSIGFTATLKREIRERDNYTCRECGSKPENTTLDVHHIDYDKTNNDSQNLITLCKSCHAKTAKRNKKFWKIYYKRKMIKEKVT